jgi:hypothetical protein
MLSHVARTGRGGWKNSKIFLCLLAVVLVSPVLPVANWSLFRDLDYSHKMTRSRTRIASSER